MSPVDVAAVKAWTENQERVNRAYRSQPLVSFHGGALPCLNDCGGFTKGKAAFCSSCATQLKAARR